MTVLPDWQVYSDGELARAAAGDRQAFAAIDDRHADRLHDFCGGMLRNRDAAASSAPPENPPTTLRDRPLIGIGTLKRMAAGGGLFMTEFWAHDRPGRIEFAAKLFPLAGGRLQQLADSGHDTGLPAALFDQCRLLSAGRSYAMGNPRLGGFGPRRRAQ